MKSKVSLRIVLVVMALLAYLAFKWDDLMQQNHAGTEVRNKGFDRRASTLYYSETGLCKMSCRNISKEEVKELMLTGEVNYALSKINAEPCPLFVLQGTTAGGRLLQVHFVQCIEKTDVQDCFDLKKPVDCSCPTNQNTNRP